MNAERPDRVERDIHDRPTLDLNDPANQGVDLTNADPLPDVPDAGPNSVPVTSPDPIDFSTQGIAMAGSIGMSTFNDGNDKTLFERTVDAYEESGAQSPQLSDSSGFGSTSNAGRSIGTRVRVYDVES